MLRAPPESNRSAQGFEPLCTLLDLRGRSSRFRNRVLPQSPSCAEARLRSARSLLVSEFRIPRRSERRDSNPQASPSEPESIRRRIRSGRRTIANLPPAGASPLTSPPKRPLRDSARGRTRAVYFSVRNSSSMLSIRSTFLLSDVFQFFFPNLPLVDGSLLPRLPVRAKPVSSSIGG